MLCAIITFVLTLAGVGVLVFFAGRHLAATVRRHPEARRAIAEFAEHVVLPLFEGRPDDQEPPAEATESPAPAPPQPRPKEKPSP
jgi:hypothetical protein